MSEVPEEISDRHLFRLTLDGGLLSDILNRHLWEREHPTDGAAITFE